MSSTPETIILPPDPRATACGAFFDALKSCRGKPVVVDASAVERVDSLVAQVMVMGRKTWSADDIPFEVLSPSDAVTTALDHLGLRDAILSDGGFDVD